MYVQEAENDISVVQNIFWINLLFFSVHIACDQSSAFVT